MPSWNPDIPRFVSESRHAQGLPPRVEDPATLATVATLLTAAGNRVPEDTATAHRPQRSAAAS